MVRRSELVHWGGVSAKFNHVDAGVKWTVTAAFTLGAAYDYTKGNNVRPPAGDKLGNQHFNQFSVIADYFLSKRTEFCVEGAYQIALDTSSTDAAAVANVGNAGDTSNSRQVLARAAIRHRF